MCEGCRGGVKVCVRDVREGVCEGCRGGCV